MRLVFKWIGYGIFRPFSAFTIAKVRPQNKRAPAHKQKSIHLQQRNYQESHYIFAKEIILSLSPATSNKSNNGRSPPILSPSVSVCCYFSTRSDESKLFDESADNFTSKVISRIVIVDLPRKRPATAIPEFPACVRYRDGCGGGGVGGIGGVNYRRRKVYSALSQYQKKTFIIRHVHGVPRSYWILQT